MMELSKFARMNEDAISLVINNPKSVVSLLTGTNLDSELQSLNV